MDERYIEARLSSFEHREEAIRQSEMPHDMKQIIMERINCQRVQFLDMHGFSDCNDDIPYQK